MFCDSTAYHDGTEQDMSFSTHDLVPGDSVGVQVSGKGDVHYYVNGQNKGRVFQHLPQHQDLWGVVFLIGGTKIQSEFSFGEYLLYVGHRHTQYTLIDSIRVSSSCLYCTHLHTCPHMSLHLTSHTCYQLRRSFLKFIE